MRLWRHISEKVKYRKSARPIPSKGPQLAFPALVDHPDHYGMSLYTSNRRHFEQHLMHEKPISVDAKLFLTKSPQKHRKLLWEPQLASKRHGHVFLCIGDHFGPIWDKLKIWSFFFICSVKSLNGILMSPSDTIMKKGCVLKDFGKVFMTRQYLSSAPARPISPNKANWTI